MWRRTSEQTHHDAAAAEPNTRRALPTVALAQSPRKVRRGEAATSQCWRVHGSNMAAAGVRKQMSQPKDAVTAASPPPPRTSKARADGGNGEI